MDLSIQTLLIMMFIAGAIMLFSLVFYLISRSPFHYPYKVVDFDVSGRRKPNAEDLIDQYLIDNGFTPVLEHQQEIEKWKENAQKKVAASRLKDYRQRQYLSALDDKNAFVFNLIRTQTRYRQKNYERTAYAVDVLSSTYRTDYTSLLNRYNELKDISFECPLSKYHSKKQRQLVTKELRQRIAERDHYTCQMCGKYMPDEVGLHIDHIIPISKGGKSVESNLQVLCSVCNGKKSNKVI